MAGMTYILGFIGLIVVLAGRDLCQPGWSEAPKRYIAGMIVTAMGFAIITQTYISEGRRQMRDEIADEVATVLVEAVMSTHDVVEHPDGTRELVMKETR